MRESTAERRRHRTLTLGFVLRTVASGKEEKIAGVVLERTAGHVDSAPARRRSWPEHAGDGRRRQGRARA